MDTRLIPAWQPVSLCMCHVQSPPPRPNVKQRQNNTRLKKID